MFESLFANRGLSLDRLRALVEVHDAGSIAHAAPGDPVRQSQYSRQLREISEFFGVEVARRHGKILKLTAQGTRLADLAREHFRSLQDFRAECRSESVDYTIAAGDSLVHWLIIPRLGALISSATPTRFALSNLRTNEIVQHLGDGRVDFGVIRKDAVSSGLKSAPLGVLSYVAVIPHALVRKGSKPVLRDVLGSLPLASQTADGQFSQRLREIAQSLGVELRPALACQSFPQMLVAVKSGAFAAILPALALDDLAPGSFLVLPAGPLQKLHRAMVLTWNPRLVDVRPRAAQLIDQLRRALQI
jgi:DNA-binding transcriptional LysR family regulator